MPSVVSNAAGDLLPAAMVRKRYGISDMTLWRWETDKKLSFPKPIRINGRRYWRLAELQTFEAQQSQKQEAA